MTAKDTVSLIGSIAWPVTVGALLLLYRKPISNLIKNVEEFRGPGGIHVALRDIREKVDSVEAATRNLSVDIYKVTGDALNVREEIWTYVARILNEVSPDTRHEMQQKLSGHHLRGLDMTISDIKKYLFSLGYSWAQEGADKGFTEEISKEFCDAVYNFQVECNMADADGIIGPKTVKKLRMKCSQDRTGTSDKA